MRQREQRCVVLEGASAVRETDRALLVEFTEGEHEGRQVWVPKSQISDDSEVYDMAHGVGRLVVSEWLARQEGLD